jgi:hypothetical protein
MTGFANFFGSLGGKWLELFKEAVPGLTRVAHVFSVNELNANQSGELPTSLDTAAARLGVTIARMASAIVTERLAFAEAMRKRDKMIDKLEHAVVKLEVDFARTQVRFLKAEVDKDRQEVRATVASINRNLN